MSVNDKDAIREEKIGIILKKVEGIAELDRQDVLKHGMKILEKASDEIRSMTAEDIISAIEGQCRVTYLPC